MDNKSSQSGRFRLGTNATSLIGPIEFKRPHYGHILCTCFRGNLEKNQKLTLPRGFCCRKSRKGFRNERSESRYTTICQPCETGVRKGAKDGPRQCGIGSAAGRGTVGPEARQCLCSPYSDPASRTAWGWGCRLAARLSKTMADGFGQFPIMPAVLRLFSRSPLQKSLPTKAGCLIYSCTVAAAKLGLSWANVFAAAMMWGMPKPCFSKR